MSVLTKINSSISKVPITRNLIIGGMLILPGANILSRVGFKLTYLAGLRFSLDVIHMGANYLVSPGIEDHQAFSTFGSQAHVLSPRRCNVTC